MPKRSRLRAVAVLACAAVPATLSTTPAHAAPAGALDRSFGGGAFTMRLAPDENDRVIDAVVEPDGSVIALTDRAGAVELVRLAPDGTVDTAFGEDGTAPVDLGPGTAAYTVVRDRDGRILVAGRSHVDGRWTAVVGRMLDDGTPDETLDGDGALSVTFGDTGSSQFDAIVPFDGGGMLLAGSHDSDVALARVHENGMLDPWFSTDGRVVHSVGAGDYVGSLLFDDDTRSATVVGESTPDGTHAGLRPYAMRVNSWGDLLPTFADDGIAEVEVPGAEAGVAQRALAGALDADGNVVIAGAASDRPMVVRLTGDGELDTGFGGSIVGAETQPGVFASVALQPDGRIVAAGARRPDATTAYRSIVTRVRADGALDGGFGAAGVATVDLGPVDGSHWSTALGLQDDGRITVAGGADVEDDHDGGYYEDALFARLLPTGTADGGDGGDGGGGGGGGGGSSSSGGDAPAPAPAPAPAVAPPPAPPVPAPAPPVRPRSATSPVPPRPAILAPGKAPRRFAGTAKGAARVEVALVRRSGKRCVTLRATKVGFMKARCARPRWLRASGTSRWALRLKGRLPRGRYTVMVRSVGPDGRRSATSRRTVRIGR